MKADFYPASWLQGGHHPASAELLQGFELANVLDDASVLQNPEGDPVTYHDLFRLVLGCPYDEAATYGELLAAQDLRYAGHWGYDRELMLFDVGADSDPVVHNIRTFNHVANAIAVEEIRETVKLTSYQKTVALATALVHDMVEGVVSDVPHGEKTPEFRLYEAAERKVMLQKAWGSVLSAEFIADVDTVIAHSITKPELELAHDMVEIGHCLTQFCASMDTAEECFLMLELDDVALSPLGRSERPSRRFNCLVGLTVEVSRATEHELQAYANKGYWLPRDTLDSYANHLRRVREELLPLSPTERHTI